MKRLATFIFIGLLARCSYLYGQDMAIKTNTLYWTTTTPNIGAEAAFGKRSTAQIFFALNPWKQSGGDKSSIRHWLVMPEYRHWFCQAFNGWFIGAHLMGGEFNAGGVKMPFGLLTTLNEHRYEGWYAGGGLSVGYQWPLSRHWNLESSVGLGYDYIQYDKFKCGTCGEKEKTDHKNYIGPTKAAVSLIYVIN